MSAARSRADALTVIAGIRDLQSRAAELEAVRAAGERREAEARRDDCQEKLAETQAGWAAAIAGGAFDPQLARVWFAALETGRAEEQLREQEVAAADEALARREAEWQAASARTDAARAQSRLATKQADRRRDEARLAAVEDRAADQSRPG